MYGLLSHMRLVWSQPFALVLMRARRGELMALMEWKPALLILLCLLPFLPRKS